MLKEIGQARYPMLASVLAIWLGVIVNAQTKPQADEEYLKTVWTTEQGLPQNSVNAIIQSRDGYLWLGTFGGLSRFDGVKFTPYNSGNTPGLKSNRILSLFEDRDGTLWMGTQSGEVMTFNNGVAVTYTMSDGLPGNHVWAIGQADDGTIWIGGNAGAARFINGRFQSFAVADGLPDRPIRSIAMDENRRLWFASEGGLLSRYDGNKFIVDDRAAVANPHLFAFLCQRKIGGFWMGVAAQVTSFSNGTLAFTPPNPPAAKTVIRSIIEDHTGALWISYNSAQSAAQNSVFRYKDGVFTRYPLNLLMRSMFEDREGNLWFGSDRDGLVRLRKRHLSVITHENGLANDSIRAITGDGANGVWIATNNGLAHWQNSGFKLYQEKDGLCSNYITSLYTEPDGSLLIGSPFTICSFKDGKFSRLASPKGTLPSAEIPALMRDRDGQLWIGSEYGLDILHDGQDQILRQSDGLISNEVHHLSQTKDGAIWIGTAHGLSRFKDGRFTNFSAAQGLSNHYVRDLFEDDDGSLWLATYGGGLNLLRGNKITSITVKNGLFDDFLSRILPDGRGSFWILSNRGIFKVRRDDLNDFVAGRTDLINTISFGVDDGMKSSEGNGGTQPAGWKTPDGKLWFSTIAGAVIIEPMEAVASLPPPTVIEQLIINRTSTPVRENIEIQPGQKDIEIAYTGLSLTRPEQIKFKYKLEGLNDNWVNAGTRRTAYFSYLPPGSYVFKVIASNSSGVWNETGAQLKIKVLPPYYRTWWFLTLIGLMIGGLVFAGYEYRVRQMRRVQTAQEAFSRQLITSQENERKRIASELHDSLGQSLVLIRNWALLGASQLDPQAPAAEELDEIKSTASRAINDVREIAYNLVPYHLDRLGLAETIRDMIENVAQASGINFTMKLDPLDDVLSREAELSLYRITQEAINNLVKHAHATNAEVRLQRLPEGVRLMVIDDGKGFDAQVTLASTQKAGFGLPGLTERARLLNGTLTIQSMPGQGTTLEILLPSERSQT